MSQFFREQTTEKSADGQAAAVARGAAPWRSQIGYTRRKDGILEPDPKTSPIVKRAFQMRAGGESITQIRAMLKSHGIARSHRGVQVMLASRAFLGEIDFGNLVNPRAHKPIIERDLFGRVQRMKIPRGRQPSSNRLLARLSVLKCGSCGARMGARSCPSRTITRSTVARPQATATITAPFRP